MKEVAGEELRQKTDTQFKEREVGKERGANGKESPLVGGTWQR